MPICLIIDTAVPRKGRQIAGEAKLCHTNAITQLVRALRSITPNDDLRAVAFNGLYRKGTELSAATRDYDKLLSAISALDTSFETTCSVADALSGIFQEHTQLNVPIGRPCHFVLVTANEALLEGGPQNQPNGLPTYCELHLLVVRHPTPPTAKRDLDSTSTDPEPPAKRIKTEAAEVKHEPGTLVNSANEGVRSNDRAVGTEGPAALPNTAEGQAEAPTTSQLMKADGMIEVSSIPNPSALALLCRSICGVNYTTDVTPDLTSPMNALAGSCCKDVTMPTERTSAICICQ